MQKTSYITPAKQKNLKGEKIKVKNCFDAQLAILVLVIVSVLSMLSQFPCFQKGRTISETVSPHSSGPVSNSTYRVTVAVLWQKLVSQLSITSQNHVVLCLMVLAGLHPQRKPRYLKLCRVLSRFKNSILVLEAVHAKTLFC